MNKGIWVLLWSKKQNCFHIEPARELCKKNVRAMDSDLEINDYHPIYIGSRETCDMAADFNRWQLIERESAHV